MLIKVLKQSFFLIQYIWQLYSNRVISILTWVYINKLDLVTRITRVNFFYHLFVCRVIVAMACSQKKTKTLYSKERIQSQEKNNLEIFTIFFWTNDASGVLNKQNWKKKQNKWKQNQHGCCFGTRKRIHKNILRRKGKGENVIGMWLFVTAIAVHKR